MGQKYSGFEVLWGLGGCEIYLSLLDAKPINAQPMLIKILHTKQHDLQHIDD